MNIIAIGAHLDDIEISAGGLIADATRAGHRVRMVAMSESDYTDLDGNPSRTREEALREGRAAAAVLGVESLEILGFPTKDVPYGSRSVEAIERQLRPFAPDLALTHWPHDTHQDHRAAALATISAARRLEKILMYEPMVPSGRSYQGFRGQLYYPITPEGQRIKEEALRAHHSQYLKYGEEVWIEAVRARSVQRGFEIGSEFAECFEVMRWTLELS